MNLFSIFTHLLLAGGAASDVALVREAIERRPAAVRTLVARLAPVIQARARRMLARQSGGRIDVHEQDDLVQLVWAALLRDDGRLLRGYDPARGASLEGYVGMVAERELGNTRRDAFRQKRGGGRVTADEDALAAAADPAVDPETAAAARQLDAALARHLDASLPEKGRLVFRLLYRDDCTPQQAAAAMQVNLQVVYNWQHKIRLAARELLT